MYRLVLFIAFVAYCSAAPFGGIGFQRSAFNPQNDDSELIDNQGAGYSFFKHQQIDSRPFAQTPSPPAISNQDLSAYMQASAFKQSPGQSQILTAGQRMSPNTIENIQGDRFMNQNQWSAQQQAGLRSMGRQQMAFPQNDLTMQQNSFRSMGGQSEDFSMPQQTWSTQQQQQPTDFMSDSQFQQGMPQNSFTQSDQQGMQRLMPQFQQAMPQNSFMQSDQQGMPQNSFMQSDQQGMPQNSFLQSNQQGMQRFMPQFQQMNQRNNFNA